MIQATKRQKNNEIHLAIDPVFDRLLELADNGAIQQTEGWRFAYDLTLHVLVALDKAGYQITRKRS